MRLHPENYSPTGKIWQTLQGLYAVGSGGLFGVGLGNSRQKHLFVSQPQNDFVFSIIAEELGFAGAVLVILLFMLLIWRGFVIALKAPDTFSSLVVIGLVSKVALQVILNIGVVTNTIPNTGISLPFFSYGGTALVTQLGEMGIVLSISRFSYQRE
jgi:cell division protein FtsW